MTGTPRAHRIWPLWLAASAFWVFITLLYLGRHWWLSRAPGVRVSLWPANVWQTAAN